MNVFRTLLSKIEAGDRPTFKYLKQIEKYERQLTTTTLPSFDFPKNGPVHFKHSGNAGDIVYAIPTIKAIAKNEDIHLHLQINQPVKFPKHIKHPLQNVMLNQKMVSMIEPLLLSQPGFKSIGVLQEKQMVDVDLDKVRDYPLLLDRGNIARWYFLVFPVTYDLNKAWLQVPADKSLKNTIVIARSLRYQAPAIDYSFLKQYPAVQFIGLPEEFSEMKQMVPQIEYRPVKDFLEMASLIAGAKLFIGNQSFPFSIAEALKVNRLLEVYFLCPNVSVYGDNGFDFCFQPQFETLVKMRYEHA